MKLLIVEDEELLRESLSESFKQAGFAIELAENGEDGLFLASEYPIDLAIVDIGLPGMSGLELIAELRKQDHQVPVFRQVLMTTWPSLFSLKSYWQGVMLY